MNRKALIFGIKTYKLTNAEKYLFKKYKPWGVILFSRNIKDVLQLKSLTDEIKKIFNDKNFPILIDEEGGKVSRLNKIIDLSMFSQDFFGRLYVKDKKLLTNYYKIYVDTVAGILKSVGININTVPVLDVRRKNAHNVIGTRSFSKNQSHVSKIGSLCIKFYEKNKIGTVFKHIPGHGFTKSDSHYKRPIIKLNKKKLIKKDFKPFKFCKSLFGMTAHVIYSVFDDKNVATHSKIMVKKIIREHINFKGILISDDISMKSLKYGVEKNALKALYSGCNLVLHCNANINEMSRLAKVVPKIDKFTEKKTSHFYKFLG